MNKKQITETLDIIKNIADGADGFVLYGTIKKEVKGDNFKGGAFGKNFNALHAIDTLFDTLNVDPLDYVVSKLSGSHNTVSKTKGEIKHGQRNKKDN